MRPTTKFAKLGNDRVGYQVLGDGPIDLVFLTGMSSHIDLRWEEPLNEYFLHRLASFSRLILFDRRGTGVSDPVPFDHLPTWEQWADDMRIVFDAVGSERAAIMAWLDGGPMAMLFAATYPERTVALVLAHTAAKYVRTDDYPHGWAPEVAEQLLHMVEELWGTDGFVSIAAPSRSQDEGFRQRYARYLRAAARPREAAAQLRNLLSADVRHVLPLIHCPTLILNRTGYRLVTTDHARYLAEHIPDARLVELPGTDGVLVTEHATEILDSIEEFLSRVPGGSVPDRVLATVLFTDIVNSTDLAASSGDRRWKAVLETHDEITRDQVARFQGRFIESTGDGVLATFDRPGRGIRTAGAIQESIRALGIDIRAGLHAGEIELREGGHRVGGIAVHIAARVTAIAAPGEILVTSTVKDLVAGSGVEFRDRGVHDLKGVPGAWRLFAVEGTRPEARREGWPR
ncbi:MAG: adenylate/guanylate cyclase domain-containing protein, partial [Chloroflexi bacterium]